MRIGRTIFAALIGLSVVALPLATSFAAAAATPTEISAAKAVPDCDHHRHTPDSQTHKGVNDRACMTDCALSCFGFVATGYSAVEFSALAIAALKPVRESDNISSRMGSPPFRPPRS